MSTDASEHQLPSKWNAKDRSPLLEVSLGLRVKYVGSGDSDKDAASVKADVPVPRACGVFYFEVKVLNRGRNGYIGVGLSAPQVPSNRLPGWDKISYGYHGDDGNSFCSSGTGQPYGPQYTTNDTVGCGICFLDNTIFFTKNGIHLGVAFTRAGLNPEDGRPIQLYPCVGLRTPGEEVEVNFGQKPFVYNIDKFREEMRVKARAIVDDTSLSAATSADLHQLVAGYLAHQGYLNAAKELCKVTGVALAEPDSQILARKSQTIWDQIMAGEMEAACATIETHFPGLLERSPVLRLEIKRRQFVEMAANLPKDDDAAFQTMIDFGRELRELWSGLDDPNGELATKLDEAYSIMAYENPTRGPMAYLLQPAQRELLAETVNSSLLVAAGRPPESGLKLALRQASDCLNLLQQADHGVAAFLDFKDYIAPQ